MQNKLGHNNNGIDRGLLLTWAGIVQGRLLRPPDEGFHGYGGEIARHAHH